jgi:hypothetical protein
MRTACCDLLRMNPGQLRENLRVTLSVDQHAEHGLLGHPWMSGISGLSLICGRSRRRGLGPTGRVLDLLGIQQQALESALEQGRRIPVIAVAPINTTLTCSQRRQADSPEISAVRVSMLRLPDPSRVVHEFLPEIRMCDRNQLESPLSESFAH